MNVTVETITPKVAAEMLTHLVPERQRRLSAVIVESYSRMMKAGMWQLTHQGVAFDNNGELVDGQHRLNAVLQSGATVQMLVAREIGGENAIDFIDRGEERKVGQQLTLRHGILNGNNVSGISRIILWICCASEKKLTGKFNVGFALKVYESFSNEIEFVIANRSGERGLRNNYVMAACAFALRPYPEIVGDFYNKLMKGENIRAGDPAFTMRKYLLTNGNSRISSELHGTRLVMTAAMKHVCGDKYGKIVDGDFGHNFFIEKQRRTVNKVLKSCGFIE